MLDIRVDLSIDYAEGEHDVEIVPKELLDLNNRYERRSQSSIDSPLEVISGSRVSPELFLSVQS